MFDKEKILKERMDFVKMWADYVKSNKNEVWSKEQAMLINSMLKNQPPLSREQFLRVTGNNFFKKIEKTQFKKSLSDIATPLQKIAQKINLTKKDLDKAVRDGNKQ